MIFKRVLIVILMLTAVLLAGAAGYIILENWDFIDAVYMSVITLSTVGYKEVAELSTAGKAFTIALIGGGVIAVTLAIGMFTKIILEGELGEYLRRRQMEKRIESLDEHIIVCGLGELGEEVVRNLAEDGEDFVVIENSEEAIGKAEKFVGDHPSIRGDARETEVLESAGISKARALITCLGSDSQNLFVVITARELNPSLTIVTEAIDHNVREKLRRAGADHIIAPTQIGGLRMSRVATKPAVVSFLDVVTGGPGGRELYMESVRVMENSEVASRTLAEARIPSKTGLIVLSIRKKQIGQFIYNPSSQTVLEPGDELIVMGEDESLRKLRKYIS